MRRTLLQAAPCPATKMRASRICNHGGGGATTTMPCATTVTAETTSGCAGSCNHDSGGAATAAPGATTVTAKATSGCAGSCNNGDLELQLWWGRGGCNRGGGGGAATVVPPCYNRRRQKLHPAPAEATTGATEATTGELTLGRRNKSSSFWCPQFQLPLSPQSQSHVAAISSTGGCQWRSCNRQWQSCIRVRQKLQGHTTTAGASGDLGDIFATTQGNFCCYDWETMGASGYTSPASCEQRRQGCERGAPCCMRGLEGAAGNSESSRGGKKRAFCRGRKDIETRVCVRSDGLE